MHVLDLVKMEKPDVRRKKRFRVYVYNYHTSPGHLNTQNTYTPSYASRKNCGLDSFSPLKQLDLIIYYYSLLLPFSSKFSSFLFVFVGKLNQRGALHSVLNTLSDAVTCSSAKKNCKVFCEPPHTSSPPVQPHRE